MSNLPRMSNGAIDWTYAGAQARLELLWNAKRPDGSFMFLAHEIGQDMGVTKSAIIGRAHRSPGCEQRPSPIRPLGSGKRPQRQRSRPPNGRQQGTGRLIGPTLDIPKRERGTGTQALGPTLPVAAEPVQPVSLGPVRACCFPMWGDERPRVPRYCEKPSKAGKPYCPVHYALCYHRVVSPGEQTLRERIP